MIRRGFPDEISGRSGDLPDDMRDGGFSDVPEGSCPNITAGSITICMTDTGMPV